MKFGQRGDFKVKRTLIMWLTLVTLAAGALAEVIPPEGTDADFLEFTGIQARSAVVLCQSLSVCGEREGQVIDTLRFGDPFVTDEERDGWTHCIYADGSRSGWVRSDYVLVDPAYYVTETQTAVYAYGDADAPRVGLLDGGEKLPIIAEQNGYFVVSLRGASGWIPAAGAQGEPERE